MKARFWTEAELEYLKDNFGSKTRVELAAELRCSHSVLNRKCAELGLYKRKEPPKVGDKLNRLTIREIVLEEKYGQMKSVAVCDCECGSVTRQLLTVIAAGVNKSCGCWKDEKASERTRKRNYKHGMADLRSNRLYRIWCAMKSRCYCHGDEGRDDYGGRGITVCDEWRDDFMAFREWAMSHGYADDLTIDRENVNGNYEPTNCRWVTRAVQAGNRRNNRRDTVLVTAFGETKTIQEWLSDTRCTAKSPTTICYRIGAGWTPEDAISRPSQR